MKTIHKLFLIATIALGLGFVACNDADDLSPVDDSKANTHVSVTLKLSTNASTRTSPDDYNYIGEWAGKDLIKKITVYLVDGLTVAGSSFTVGAVSEAGVDYEFTKKANGEIYLEPKSDDTAIKTTAGTKKVYVVINPTDEVTKLLNKTKVEEFERAYEGIYEPTGLKATSTESITAASKLATSNATDESIVMTNIAPHTLIVEPNITKEETLGRDGKTIKNRASLTVERTVARVMVTIAEGETTLNLERELGENIGTFDNVTWVVAQGEKSLYVQRKFNWETPNHTWVPSGSDYITHAGDKYDYSGLFENYDTSTKFGGTAVPTMEAYSASLKTGDLAGELDSLRGKFILPTTHAVGEKAASNYKKGNTAYVLIRTRFTPGNAFFADKDVAGFGYTTGQDFYVGGNGKFYTSATNAVTPATGGVAGQTVARYVGGKVLYYAWLNPDKVAEPYNSPVLRNNIYHIHITGFKNLGTNWNPLFPEDPDNPKTPENGGNPDPKPTVTPGDPKEPTNPIDPNDPLTTPETWMSVDVKVLPWKVHSYSVDLGI